MSLKKKAVLFYGVIFILVLVLILGYANSGIKIKVGNQKITEKIINYEIGVTKAYSDNPENTASNFKIPATVELMRLMLEKEVALKNNLTVTPQEISDFSEYVDKNTKAPKILDKIKEIFTKDQESYRNTFLAPKINILKLQDFYTKKSGSINGFDEWFQKEAQNIPIQIFDKELKGKICTQYQAVWWLKTACK